MLSYMEEAEHARMAARGQALLGNTAEEASLLERASFLDKQARRQHSKNESQRKRRAMGKTQK